MDTQKRTASEHRYRKTSSALVVLVALWIAAMLLALVIPARLWKSGIAAIVFFEIIFPLLFVVAVVLGVVSIVSYIRWTGKYPYHFLFGKPSGVGRLTEKGEKDKPSEESTNNGLV